MRVHIQSVIIRTHYRVSMQEHSITQLVAESAMHLCTYADTTGCVCVEPYTYVEATIALPLLL